GLLGDLVGSAGAVGGWLRDGGTQLLATAGHYASRFTYPSAILDASLTVMGAWQRARRAADRPCSEPSVRPPPPTERRVAVLVAGLGSHSRGSTVDQVATDELGYAAPDVVRFSYAGGRVPDPTDGFGAIAATEYEAPDTQADLRVTAAHLADLVEAVAATAPGVPVDLYAHSQGGVVARLALIELARRHGAAWLEHLGLVATLGSPHGGADLATAIHALSSTRTGARVLDGVTTVTGQELDHDGTSVAQLAETSGVVAELAAHPVPEGVDAVSIAARGDVVVPVPRSVAPGMTEVVVPLTGLSAHSDLPGSPAATRELALALAGLAPGCQSFVAALTDQAVGEGISLVEDLAGAAGLLAAARSDVRGE
ncbi:MAG: alpha/beta hydrolase, partial [Acidimicrobiales bacterium]